MSWGCLTCTLIPKGFSSDLGIIFRTVICNHYDTHDPSGLVSEDSCYVAAIQRNLLKCALTFKATWCGTERRRLDMQGSVPLSPDIVVVRITMKPGKKEDLQCAKQNLCSFEVWWAVHPPGCEGTPRKPVSRWPGLWGDSLALCMFLRPAGFELWTIVHLCREAMFIFQLSLGSVVLCMDRTSRGHVFGFGIV